MRKLVYEFDWDLDGDQNEDALEYVAELLASHWNGAPIIVDATLGLWSGPLRVVGLFYTLDEAIRVCNPTRIYVDKGRVFIEYDHHDGTNVHELRQLTKRGQEWFEYKERTAFSKDWLKNHLLATKGYTRRFIAKGGPL